jgi:hypothetical protein
MKLLHYHLLEAKEEWSEKDIIAKYPAKILRREHEPEETGKESV